MRSKFGLPWLSGAQTKISTAIKECSSDTTPTDGFTRLMRESILCRFFMSAERANDFWKKKQWLEK